MSRGARARRLAARLGLAIAATVASLLVAELLVAVLVPAPGAGIHFVARARACCRLDDRLIWTFRPGVSGTWGTDEFEETASINSIGMRDHEIGPKRPGELRILAIGDSFTYGHGVQLDESYPKVVERALDGQVPRAGAVSVLNAGQPGYGIDQSFESFRLRRLELEPDLVLVGLHSTDVLDDVDKPLFDLRDGVLIPLDARRNWIHVQARIRDALPRLLNGSKLVRLALSSLRRWPGLRGGAVFAGEQGRAQALQRDKVVAEMVALRDLGAARGFRVAVVLMPSEWALHDPSWSPFGDLPGRIRALGIPVLDLLRGLDGAVADPARLFFARDKHLDVEGNRVLGGLVARWLVAEGLPARAR